MDPLKIFCYWGVYIYLNWIIKSFCHRMPPECGTVSLVVPLINGLLENGDIFTANKVNSL